MLAMTCDICRQLEDAILEAHNARVEARSHFEHQVNTRGARELFEKYRDANDAYDRALKAFRTHRDMHGVHRSAQG